MDIGTAKPSLSERAGIPHHLLDILDPSESFSTGQFRRRALDLIADIQQRGKAVILVGGTMLYFNALTQGLAQLPHADADIRQKLDAELLNDGKEVQHARLARIDPEAAARIHVNDPQRVQRALEVYELTGQSLTSFFQQQSSEQAAYRWLKIIIAPEDRQILHHKIAQRFHAMLELGFLAEVEALMQRGDLNEQMPAIRSVGYRQAWAYLNGEDDYVTMQDKAIAATRQLAKRQFTWLRREENALHLLSDAADIDSKALTYCREGLIQ